MTKPKNFPGRKNERRKEALLRLKSQLKAGTKPEKKTNNPLLLNEKDVKRIKKQIEILEHKIS
jgi:hypothetical protein